MAEIIAIVVNHDLRQHWRYFIEQVLDHQGVSILEHLLEELASSLVECQLDDYPSIEGLKFLRLCRCVFEGTHGLQ